MIRIDLDRIKELKQIISILEKRLEQRKKELNEITNDISVNNTLVRILKDILIDEMSIGEIYSALNKQYKPVNIRNALDYLNAKEANIGYEVKYYL